MRIILNLQSPGCSTDPELPLTAGVGVFRWATPDAGWAERRPPRYRGGMSERGGEVMDGAAIEAAADQDWDSGDSRSGEW